MLHLLLALFALALSSGGPGVPQTAAGSQMDPNGRPSTHAGVRIDPDGVTCAKSDAGCGMDPDGRV
jgi:hypothetical protein